MKISSVEDSEMDVTEHLSPPADISRDVSGLDAAQQLIKRYECISQLHCLDRNGKDGYAYALFFCLFLFWIGVLKQTALVP